MRRIAAIDGLRGVAVILVMIYHFDLGFPAGSIGVDVFFTISGFVIVRRLLHQFATSTSGTKDLMKGFYVGRFWRLFPALAVMIIAVIGLSQLLNPVLGRPDRNVANGFTALAGLANWFTLLHPDESGIARPLLHTWSLSIEEQFYVCIPLLLAAFRRHAQTAAYVLGGLCIAVSALPLPNSEPNEQYFFTLARLAPLGFGVLLAAFLHPLGDSASYPDSLGSLDSPSTSSFRKLQIKATDIVFLAAGLLLLPTLRWSSWNARSMFPVGLALLGLVTAGLLGLLTLDRTGVVSAVLKSRPAQYVGSRSYSLYLWHFPLAHLFMSQPRPVRTLAWIVLSFLAAELSYQLVEKPFRSHGNPLRSEGRGATSDGSATSKATSKAVSIPGGLVRRIPLVSTSCFFLIGLFSLLKT